MHVSSLVALVLTIPVRFARLVTRCTSILSMIVIDKPFFCFTIVRVRSSFVQMNSLTKLSAAAAAGTTTTTHGGRGNVDFRLERNKGKSGTVNQFSPNR